MTDENCYIFFMESKFDYLSLYRQPGSFST